METKTKKRYTIEFKSKIILYYESLQDKENLYEKSMSRVERQIGIDRRLLGTWLKKSDTILYSFNKRKSYNYFLQIKSWKWTHRTKAIA